MPGSTAIRSEWVNPLEKIEQLLTCAICLDRYRTPKLLPCQHTFCMEPCMDGLVDPVRRLLKCPECRAEHPLPYDGVRAFQTNYTLMGFLEIHLESTSESAEELEAYVKRFNMERCRQCNEKAEVGFCSHCEKRICEECKSSHVDMLKRDLNRLMNQVKRIASRITEASGCLTKGLDSLTTNVDAVKEEIQDYVRRFMKELIKREDVLLTELDTFSSAELRMMRCLKENLELESNNINEACGIIEACVKGEKELSDEELVRYKRMFTDGLDYLRLFNPDSEDFAIKKVRFQPGPDPQILPHAIAQFGELHVCTTHFNKYQTTEAFVPRFGALGIESDNVNLKRRSWDPSDPGSWLRRDDESPPSGPLEKRYERLGRRQNAEKDGAAGNNYGGRYNRTGRYSTQALELSPRPGNSRAGIQFQNSPWNRPTQANSNDVAGLTESSEMAAADEPGSSTAAPDMSNSKRLAANRLLESQDDDELSKRIETIRTNYEIRKQNRDNALKDGPSRLQSPAASETGGVGTSAQSSSPAPARKENEESKTAAQDKDARNSQSKPSAIPRYTPSWRSKSNNISQAETATETDTTTASDEPEAEFTKPDEAIESVPIPVKVYPTPPKEKTPEKELEERPESSQTRRSSAVAMRKYSSPEPVDWKKYLIPTDEPSHAGTAGASASQNRYPSKYMDPLDKRRRFVRSRTNPNSNSDTSDSSGDEEPTSPKDGSSYLRSRTTDDADTRGGRRRFRLLRTDSSSATDLSKIPDSADTTQDYGYGSRNAERRNRYKRKTERSHSGYAGVYAGWVPDTTSRGTPGPGIERERERPSENRHEMSLNVPDGGKYYRVFTQPMTNYLEKGRTLVKFGSKGSGDAQFNWPRGVTVMPFTDEVAICDSSNHRVQIFDHRGVFQRSFGVYGSGKGAFDCLAGICMNKYKQFIVTDRYNHRVQIFDANGQCLREFGSQGQTNGRFSSPWGVVVDNQGFIYVCDKDNHRVQIFQADGNFVGKFGGIGNHEGHFQNPHFITCNKNNHLIVSDSSNHRVQVFDHNGHFIFAFGTEGFHDGQLKYPRGVAVDSQGFIIVADSGNNRIQIFYPDGRFYCTFGIWGTGDGQMKQVEGVAITTSGRIVVTDRENHRVQIF